MAWLTAEASHVNVLIACEVPQPRLEPVSPNGAATRIAGRARHLRSTVHSLGGIRQRVVWQTTSPERSDQMDRRFAPVRGMVEVIRPVGAGRRLLGEMPMLTVR